MYKNISLRLIGSLLSLSLIIPPSIGKIAILEFSKPKVKWFIPFFRFYFNRVVTLLGAMLSRKDAFLYLPESVDYFLSRKELSDKMKSIGFKEVGYSDYTFGIATIYTGVKS